jgi:DNA-binding response OmpR family regulator
LGRIAFLTDRSPAEALPAVLSLGPDVKTEPLGQDSVSHLLDLGPSAIIVDAIPDPERAYNVLSSVAASRMNVPIAVIVSGADLERFAWEEIGDELVDSHCSTAELRVRLAMLTRRIGGGGEAVLRLGPLTINVETYQVAVAGAVLDLTYKEFELLRFLIQHPGKVFTRTELLQEVWGYNFYGGTRTVDVHVRRLRAKLGPEHDGLIQTVRGVGYRAAEPRVPEQEECAGPTPLSPQAG